MNTHKIASEFNFLKVTLVLTSIMLITAGTIFAQKVWTLEDCINHAIEHNIRIKQSRLEVEAAEISQLESKLGLLPSLNSGVSHSYGWGRSVDMATYQYVDKQTQSSYFSVNSDVLLFNGFQKVEYNKAEKGRLSGIKI
jgi:outer membrane protein